MNYNIVFEIVGFIAGICTAIVFLPQSIQTVRLKSTKGLSLTSYVIYNIGMICWITYGWYMSSIQMIVFNSISLIFSAIILYMIIKDKMHKK